LDNLGFPEVDGNAFVRMVRKRRPQGRERQGEKFDALARRLRLALPACDVCLMLEL
jgi:hypothetical protein